MATVLDRDQPDVVAAITRSREILERLGARPFLERLARADDAVPGLGAPTSPGSIAIATSPTAAPD